MDSAAEKNSIGFEKNKMTALYSSANQMRNAGMMQRLASPDPNDRRTAGNNFAHFFMRNGMAVVGMQDFCRIHKVDRTGDARKTQFPREPGQGEVRSKPQGKPHHAL